MRFHNFYTVQVGTVYQKALFNSCLFLFLRLRIQKKKTYSAQLRLHRVLLKKVISV